MTLDELEKLEIGDAIKYGPFGDLIYGGLFSDDRTKNPHVTMIDGLGDKKKVYKDLFLKYGSVK